MNEVIIFYSWQSDDREARKYIEGSIESAIRGINSSNKSIVNIDRDTKGEMGSPNIPSTIEGKISKCDIFIADLSVISENNGKKQINQNVMYETGYAMAKKGEEYCILLHNSDSCEPKDLPFDIAQRRLLVYSKKDKNLEQKLKEIFPLYVEMINLGRQVKKNTENSLSKWEIKVMKLFKSISGEKRIYLSKAGQIRLGIQSAYDTRIGNEMQEYTDSQEIRAAFSNLVDNKYLEKVVSDAGSQNYRLLQKGYDYISSMR